MAAHTPNSMVYNKAKYKPHDRNKFRVAKGSWDAAVDGTLDAGDSDTLPIVTVPKNCIILGVSLTVETAETANGTIDVGVSGTYINDDLDLYYDALPIVSTLTFANTGVGGSVFTGAGDVEVTVTATTDTADIDIDGAKFHVFVTYIELDAQAAKN